MSRPKEKLQFLKSDDFIKDLQLELCKPIEEIVFIYFKIIYGNYFKKIYPLLLIALDLGAKVEIYVDGVFSKLNLVNGIFLLPVFGKSKLKQKKAQIFLSKAFTNLQQKGAKIHYFNIPDSFISKYVLPFAGRDHRKFIYIKKDDGSKISYFGSCNLDQGGLNDFMIKNVDSDLSEILLKENLEIWEKPRLNDKVIKLSDSEILMIDSGKKFQSTIYNTAIKRIKQAKQRIIFVSQLPPEPHLLFEFVRARLRGVNVDVIIPAYSHNHVSGFPYIIVFLFAKLICYLFKINLIYTSSGFTHAKILIYDERVLLGSHNLSYVGVAAGTLELSLDTDNRELLKASIDFVNNLR